jgi:hypothetical protein
MLLLALELGHWERQKWINGDDARHNRKDAYGFFLEPVDQSVITDYSTVIKRPMDLGVYF